MPGFTQGLNESCFPPSFQLPALTALNPHEQKQVQRLQRFPSQKVCNGWQKPAKGRETKGPPMAAEREALDFCERLGFKTHRASSLRPNPNRKFVINLANMHAQLQEVAHAQKRRKSALGAWEGGDKRSMPGRCSKCTDRFPGSQGAPHPKP